MVNYDYIIIGDAAAGLMLADVMGKDTFFGKSNILLIDKDPKHSNDRTWCFWEKEGGCFDGVFHKTWDHIYFGGKEFSKRFNILPYTDKIIRGIDFYISHLKRIKSYTNISFKQETVEKVEQEFDYAIVSTGKSEYHAKQGFNSIYDYKMAMRQKKYPVLQQHFIGWFVKTPQPIFNEDMAIFMDFSIPQKIVFGTMIFFYWISSAKTIANGSLFLRHFLKIEPRN